jgi:hypothetical protein
MAPVTRLLTSLRRPERRRAAAVLAVALGAGALVIAFAPSGSAATATHSSAASVASVARAADFIYTCPDAPAGWKAWTTNPTLFGPTKLQGDHTPTIEPGADQEDVNCDYSNGNNVHFRVTGVVDLPVDPNPINDFYFGCGSKDVPWDNANRRYLVMSRTSWSYVEFQDLYNALTGSNDVANFQSLAKVLLHNIEKSAHDCTLDTTHQQAVQASWGFDFELSISTGSNGKFNAFGGVGVTGGGGFPPTSPIPDGSFITQGGPNSKNDYKVHSIHIPDVALTVIQNGKSGMMTLHFTKALEFYYKAPVAKLVLGVKVIHSHVPGCGKGSVGQLTAQTYFSNTVSAAPTLKLALCGKFFSPPGIRAQTPKVDIVQS